MRVGVNCFPLEPHIGGVRQYFVTLFRELLADDDGNDYVFFWSRGNAGELEQLGTDRWREHAVRLDDQRQVLDHLDRIDLYFCPLAILYPRPLPRPTVMTLVDIQETFYPQFFEATDRYMRELHFPTSTRMADRVVTISEFSRRTLVERFRLPAARVKVVHLCADERFGRCGIERRPAAPLPERFLLYPANWWKHKNHALLFQALGHLRHARGRRFDLVLTGFGQDAESPRRAAAEHGVGDQVHALGYRPLEELAYLYRHAVMLVFPSLFEGFGMPLVEAMACGCPVVAARDTSIPEVVGDAAELFDPSSPTALADAIVRVADDPARREALTTRGHARAGRFSAAQLAQGHREAFAEAAGVYSRRAFLWHRWVTGYWHRARLELRWRGHHRRTLLQCLRASRGWIHDPAR